MGLQGRKEGDVLEDLRKEDGRPVETVSPPSDGREGDVDDFFHPCISKTVWTSRMNGKDIFDTPCFLQTGI